jgi:hypothetical protein
LAGDRIITMCRPVIDGAKENMQAIGHAEDYFEETIVSADTAYHSSESIKKCAEEKIDAYIPDKDFRKRDPRFAGKAPLTTNRRKQFSRDDFQYDAAVDQYICPNGKRLRHNTSMAKASGMILCPGTRLYGMYPPAGVHQ